jgi:hypothetical protein
MSITDPAVRRADPMADWRLSAKGNRWRRMRGHNCTIFIDKRTGLYKLVLSYPDDAKPPLFSPLYQTMAEAKHAGHQALLNAAYPEREAA